MILESRPLHKKKKRLAKNRSRDSSRDSSQSVSVGPRRPARPLLLALRSLLRRGGTGRRSVRVPPASPSSGVAA